MTQFLYNPDQKSKKQLIEEFVVRTEVLDDILNDIETSDMSKPEQHYLIVGQRGTGKTTLLHRIKYAIEDSKTVNKWLIPITFGEEQYNITELANLWENIAQSLEDYHQFEGITEEMERHIDKSNFEEYCFDILEKNLEIKGKRIVLLIDNIGDLLKKIGRQEVQRLREVLQTNKYLRLIAGTPFYLESILDYSQPFFEFFKIQRLDGLSKEQAEKLLLKLGEIHNQKETIERIIKETPERIDTLRILTSGVPRTIGLMYQIFIDHEHESSIKDLELILDAVTPLYKHRMDDLPTQQQKIVDAVAKNWDAISIKDLKTRVRLDGKNISAQLRQLEKNQIIEKRETNTKNHLYLLKERFWNIWYLMRYGRRTDSERVIWLVRFLESWCSKDDFEKRITNYISQISSGKLDEETTAFYGQVYASIKNISLDQKYLLKKNTPSTIADKICLSEPEAVEIAKKLSTENKHLDAVLILIESDTLDENNKGFLYEEISKVPYDILIDLGKKAIFEKYVEYLYAKQGYLTFIIEIISKAILMILVRKEHESLNTFFKILPDILINAKKEELNYEYNSISRIVMVLVMFKQFSMAHDFIDKLEAIDVRNRIKPMYYTLLSVTNDERINIFGEEVKKSALPRIRDIKKFWKETLSKLE